MIPRACAAERIADAGIGEDGLWIETARESGDPVPEPKGERLMLA